MSPSYWGENGPISSAEFRQMQVETAAKKAALFGSTPNRMVGGKERVGFSKSRSDKAARSDKTNPAYMQRFLSSDFSMAEVNWSDEGWDFLAYH